MLERKEGEPMNQPRWRRKWATDVETDGWSPVPTQVVSNEEYLPLRQTPAQEQVARRLWETSRVNAGALGMTRRQFLTSPCGTAAAFLAMNGVFGRFFDVDPVEAWEISAAAERQPQGQFVFDIQTHHVAAPRSFLPVLSFRGRARRWDPSIWSEGRMEEVYLENYIKEVFLDSDTAVAVLSVVAAVSDAVNFMPPDKIAETREIVNRLVASRRVLTHGLISPTQGRQNLENMERQVAELKVSAWKGYTGELLGSSPPQTWAADDEKVAYPVLEAARRLGVKNVCLHKSLPFAGTVADNWHPRDIEKAARDFPDLNFIVYHAGFKSVQEGMRFDPGRRDSWRVDWVTDLCEIRQRNPRLTNIYAEIGSTFGMTVITAPLLCGHILGMLIQHLGVDHVLWGTDSIWWGSPRWQIEAFRRFALPETLLRTFGYPPLTTEVKARILGLNAAPLHGVDPNATINPVPGDFVSRMMAAYLEEEQWPTRTQYGWVLST
jgi:predicted TIM-barrel fold metal-dependent hydrolase